MHTFSFQLYSARNFPPLSDVLKTVAEAGYKQVEGYGALYAGLDDDAVKAFRADLDANGLTMPTAHFSLDLLEKEPARALEIAQTLGIRAIYCPHLMADQRPIDAEGWKAFGARLDAAGKPFRDAGILFGWHNHDFEFAKLEDGGVPLEHIFIGGPDLSWEADIAWIVRGGADPFDWIKRHGNRITAVHVKDIASAGENESEDGWADVGHGTLDWKLLLQTLRQTPAAYYVVEHDNPSDLQRLADRSIASLKSW